MAEGREGREVWFGGGLEEYTLDGGVEAVFSLLSCVLCTNSIGGLFFFFSFWFELVEKLKVS